MSHFVLTAADYKRMRDAYSPKKLRAIFVLESPPKTGKYFYNPNGLVTEQLFGAMMRLLGLSPKDKNAGLQEFQRRGFIVVDASYEPVNGLADKARDKKILESFPALVRDLISFDSARNTPLILVKANICTLLRPRLDREGFAIANHNEKIPFPGSGRQKEFHEKTKSVLARIDAGFAN
jgi:hypothetical protein